MLGEGAELDAWQFDFMFASSMLATWSLFFFDPYLSLSEFGDWYEDIEGVLHVVLVFVGPHVHVAQHGYGRKGRVGTGSDHVRQ